MLVESVLYLLANENNCCCCCCCCCAAEKAAAAGKFVVTDKDGECEVEDGGADASDGDNVDDEVTVVVDDDVDDAAGVSKGTPFDFVATATLVAELALVLTNVLASSTSQRTVTSIIIFSRPSVIKSMIGG